MNTFEKNIKRNKPSPIHPIFGLYTKVYSEYINELANILTENNTINEKQKSIIGN